MGRRAIRTLGVLVGIFVIIGVVGAVAPSAVSAHDELISSNPATGATVPRLPRSVLLTFHEPPVAGYTKVRVTSASGRVVSRGAVVSNGARISIALQPESAPGDYTAQFSVLSDDGHPVVGSVRFTVAARSTVPAAAAAGSSRSNTRWWSLTAAGLAVVVLVFGAARKFSPAPSSARPGR